MADRAKAIEYLQKSGVVNTKMTLGEMLETSARLESLNPGTLSAWTFISPNFVYTGDEPVRAEQVVVSR